MNESKDDSFQLDHSLEKRRQNGRVRLLGGENSILMNGVNILVKQTLESSLSPSTVRTQLEDSSREPGNGALTRH